MASLGCAVASWDGGRPRRHRSAVAAVAAGTNFERLKLFDVGDVFGCF